MRFFSDFLYKSICCGYSFELHRQVDAIQMSIHNICLCKKEVEYTCCNLKTMDLLDCTLIGVCAVIRSNTVICFKTECETVLKGDNNSSIHCTKHTHVT